MLKVCNLQKNFDDNILFEKLCFEITTFNEFVLVTGESGKGKSTFINILSFQDMNYGGAYEIMGTNVSKLLPFEKAFIRNRFFGFVYQNYGLLLDQSVEENILLPHQYSDIPIDFEWFDEIINTLGISELKNKSLCQHR